MAAASPTVLDRLAHPTIAQMIPLVYTPTPKGQAVQKVPLQKPIKSLPPQSIGRLIPNADQVFTPPHPVQGGGNVLFLSKKGDPENLYAAYYTENALYDLGMIGGLGSVEQSTVSMSNLFGKPLLRIEGIYGANDQRTTYYQLDKNVPVMLLDVDGNVMEADLDGDRQKEIIASSGTPAVTNIYKWKTNRFLGVNLNRKLGAVSVLPLSNNQFQVLKTPESKPVTYKYTKDNTLQPVTS